MKEFDLAVYIGRFQPIHNGHLYIMKQGLEVAKELLIVVGSRNKKRRTAKNPWVSDERESMIRRSLEKSGAVMHRVHIMHAFDVIDDDDCWREQVHEGINRVVYDQMVEDDFNGDGPDPKVTLIGYEKDASSYYLRTFPGLVYSPMAVPQWLLHLNATDVRRAILNKDPDWGLYVPDGAKQYIEDWLRTHDLPKEG